MAVFVTAILALTPVRQPQAQQVDSSTLRGTWTPSPPYQTATPSQSLGTGGLDIEILSRIANELGLQLEMKRKPWSAQLDGLLAGRSDVASGAFEPAGGDKRFLYSVPYRQARLSLFLRTEDQDRRELSDVADLVGTDKSFRIGVIPERNFEDARLNAAIHLAETESRAVHAQSDEENIINLLTGKIDGFVGDRLGVAASALAADLMFRTYEKVLPSSSGVHFIFSKATVSPETVARFNSKIDELRNDGTLRKLVNRRVFATVVAYAFDQGHQRYDRASLEKVMPFDFSNSAHYNPAEGLRF